jgi:hypothetical protein
MSEESNLGNEEPVNDAVPAPKVRRISNKNPRKTAKVDKEAEPESAASPVEIPIEEFDSETTVERQESDAKPETASDTKRKNNRRRRGKGKSQSNDDESEADKSEQDKLEGSPEKDDNKSSRHQHQQKPNPPQKPRVRLDPEKVAKNAWKIYLAEVSEEGVALIADNDARELARRCFRLSELFLEEAERRN